MSEEERKRARAAIQLVLSAIAILREIDDAQGRIGSEAWYLYGAAFSLSAKYPKGGESPPEDASP